MPTSRAPAHKPCGMLEITGTPVRASSGARSSSVLKPPHDSEHRVGVRRRSGHARAELEQVVLRDAVDGGDRLEAHTRDDERLEPVLDQERAQALVDDVVVGRRDGNAFRADFFQPSMTPLLIVVARKPDASTTDLSSLWLNASP